MIRSFYKVIITRELETRGNGWKLSYILEDWILEGLDGSYKRRVVEVT